MEILQGVWKQHLRPRAVVGYGVKIFLPSPPNYVTRSPGKILVHNLSLYCQRSQIHHNLMSHKSQHQGLHVLFLKKKKDCGLLRRGLRFVGLLQDEMED